MAKPVITADYLYNCDLCEESPTVVVDGKDSELCGTCYFGLGTGRDPEQWVTEVEEEE